MGHISPKRVIFVTLTEKHIAMTLTNYQAKILLFIAVCLYTLTFPTYASTSHRMEQMEHFTINEGLSSNMVHNISEDSMGHIWACTDFGLSVFDGSVFKRFEKSDYPSILRNDFFCSGVRKDGSVIIGSHLGVALMYDAQNDNFKNIAPTDFEETYYKQVSGFFTSKQDNTYMWTSGGIYVYNPKEERFVKENTLYDLTKDQFIFSLYKDDFNRYWVATYNTLTIISEEGKIIRNEHLNLGDMYASKIVALEPNKILITCFSNMVIEYTLDANGKVSEPHKIKLPFSNITSILKDKAGKIWFTTDGAGLWYTDETLTEEANFVSVTPTGADQDAITKLYGIIESKDGDLWIATQNSGVWRLKRNKGAFISLSQDIPFPNKMCTDFTESEDGTIYISSDGKGITKHSNDLKSYEPIRGQENNNNALCLSQDKDGYIWIATWGGGIQVYNPKNGTFRQEKFEELKSTLNCFFSVKNMKNGEIWVCTGGDGLYVKRTNGHWEKCSLPFGGDEYDMWAYGTTEGTNNTRWVFTTRSIWRINGEEKRPLIADISKQKSHDPISMNDAKCDKEGNLFVCCDQFLLRFSEDGNRCDTLDFMPKDNYSSIEILSNEEIIVSGSKGIYRIDYGKKEFSRFLYDFRANGTGRFRAHGSYILKDGRILFGTKDGFLVLTPNQKEEGIITHHFGINCNTINGMPYRKCEVDNITRKDGSIERISLKHNQTEICFNVDLVNFFPKEITTEYRLEGLSDKWTEVDENRKIKFTYIPSGEYTLQVRSYISGSHDDAETREVKITVLPPWWQTWWFKTISIILLALLVGAIAYLKIRNLKREQIILQQKVAERTHELDVKNTELQHALQDKDRLISVVAHDLKNPMFAIVGTLETLVNKNVGDENEKRKALVDVHASAQTLQDEMVRLLEWAKAKKEDIECKITDVNIKNALENISALLGGLVQGKKQTLSYDLDLKNCARTDSRMFSTIIRNLINNAVKFTPEGGKIAIKAWQESDSIKVRVSDSGVGMSQEKIDQLMNNGHVDSTLGTSQEKGSGLGLGLCLEYVNRIGGTMAIQSAEGEGTAITIAVPISDKIAEENSASTQPQESDHLVDKELLAGNTALVVEDDPLIRQNIQHTLERFMTVITAENGAEAIQLAEQNDFDIILSDVEMPIMNGIDMSRKMATMDQTYGVPLLFLSAKTDESDRLMGLLSGAVDYIPKPFSSNELLIKVNNILTNRRKQQLRLLQQNISHPSAINESASVPTEEITEKKEERMNPFLQKMVEEISKNYKDSDFSIETLAESMNVSQSTLARKIKSITGKTPIEILVEYRLNAAMSMLKENDEGLQINEIAYECGFTDPAYFTRKFKDFFGHTPREVK